LESAYQRGREVFYAELKRRAAEDPALDDTDRDALTRVRRTYPRLYEQLMNFYPYAARGIDPEDGFSESSFSDLARSLAAELIEFVRDSSPAAELGSLEAAAVAAGYRARRSSPDFRRFLRLTARSVKNHWAWRELDIRRAQESVTGRGVRIAIVDTGLDPTIEEIKHRVVSYKDFLSAERPFWGRRAFPFDWGGHGTSVASVVSRVAPGAELLAVRVFDQESMGDTGNWWTLGLIESGIAWAAGEGADIVNLSSAVWCDVGRMRSLVRHCWERNIILVTSVGNVTGPDEAGRTFYPAAYPETIAVGGVEESGEGLRVWEHSASADYVDVVAPAASIWVEQPSYLDRRAFPRRANGNSLATAIVSGTAALVLAAMDPGERESLREEPGALVERVRRILRKTASNAKLGLAGRNPRSGWGMIDPPAAVAAARHRGRD
jgi:subtilisin family serine protease